MFDIISSVAIWSWLVCWWNFHFITPEATWKVHQLYAWIHVAMEVQSRRKHYFSYSFADGLNMVIHHNSHAVDVQEGNMCKSHCQPKSFLIDFEPKPYNYLFLYVCHLLTIQTKQTKKKTSVRSSSMGPTLQMMFNTQSCNNIYIHVTDGWTHWQSVIQVLPIFWFGTNYFRVILWLCNMMKRLWN